MWSIAKIHRIVARGGGRTEFSREADARGLHGGKRLRSPRAGREAKVSASTARDGCIVVMQRITPARSWVTDSSGSRGGAGSPIEGKQKAFVPPPAGRAGRVPREVFRGKYRIPLAGFASRGRVVSPRRETRRPPLGAFGALPPRFARLRGRGLPRFCRLHHVGPLRPGIMNILRNTLKSGVFHMNLPSQPLRIQRYLVSHPA